MLASGFSWFLDLLIDRTLPQSQCLRMYTVRIMAPKLRNRALANLIPDVVAGPDAAAARFFASSNGHLHTINEGQQRRRRRRLLMAAESRRSDV